jgi:hypothetical protein
VVERDKRRKVCVRGELRGLVRGEGIVERRRLIRIAYMRGEG